MTEDFQVATIQCLTFKLGEELFALDIGKVREVMDYSSITKVPQTPDYMRGVINLRGSVVPVLDLRIRFGMPQVELTVNTCVIIVEAEINGSAVVLGAMADAVQEVLDLEPDQIEHPPRIGLNLNTSYLRGMGKCGSQFVMILDIDKVFGETEVLIDAQNAA